MIPTRGWIYGPLDPADQWFSEDKISHYGWAAAVFAHGAAYSVTRGWVEVIAAIILLEVWQVLRYQRWAAAGFPSPWPFLTDKASPKDIIAGLLGALTMSWLLP